LAGAIWRNKSEYIGWDRFIPSLLKQTLSSYPLLLSQEAAEVFPLKNKVFDLIFCIKGSHHFYDPECFIKEFHRLLRQGGTVAIIGMDPRDPYNQWYIYEFLIAQCLWTWGVSQSGQRSDVACKIKHS